MLTRGLALAAALRRELPALSSTPVAKEGLDSGVRRTAFADHVASCLGALRHGAEDATATAASRPAASKRARPPRKGRAASNEARRRRSKAGPVSVLEAELCRRSSGLRGRGVLPGGARIRRRRRRGAAGGAGGGAAAGGGAVAGGGGGLAAGSDAAGCGGAGGLSSALGALIYVFSTCGFGQLVSTFTRTQVAAVFATTVIAIIPTVNFSGLLVPVSSLTGQGRVIGLMFPMAWFQPISVGTFTKGLTFSDLWLNALVLALFAAGYFIAAHIVLRKQET